MGSLDNPRTISKDDEKAALILSVSVIVTNVVAYLLLIFFRINDYIYPHLFSPSELFQQSIGFFWPALVAMVLFLLRKTTRRSVEVIAFIMLFFAAPYSGLCFLVTDKYSLPFGSLTQDSSHYMELDLWASNYYPLDYFPKSIPESATDIHYCYRLCRDIDPVYDVYLKITLPEDDFNYELQRIQALYLDAEVMERSNGIVVYQIELIRRYDCSRYFFVSFCASDRTVTYVLSSISYDNQGDFTPYFKEISPGLYD